jgi:peptidoglycan hydrolase-like protein with peptidoglycan-binding domain
MDNNRRVFIGLLAVSVLPFFASAQLAQSSCPNLSRNLSLGSRGADVITLQDFPIAQDFLAQGNDTGYFGRLTKAAAIQFQTQQSLPMTGFVGLLTRPAIAKVCEEGQTVNQNTDQTTNTKQQTEQNAASAFSASPTSGSGSLMVQFKATGPIGTRPGNIVIFGDGASGSLYPAPVCAGCDPQSIEGHNYTSPGTYTATFKDSSNNALATVTIAVSTKSNTLGSQVSLTRIDNDAQGFYGDSLGVDGTGYTGSSFEYNADVYVGNLHAATGTSFITCDNQNGAFPGCFYVVATVPQLPPGTYPVTLVTSGVTSNSLNFTVESGQPPSCPQLPIDCISGYRFVTDTDSDGKGCSLRFSCVPIGSPPATSLLLKWAFM